MVNLMMGPTAIGVQFGDIAYRMDFHWWPPLSVSTSSIHEFSLSQQLRGCRLYLISLMWSLPAPKKYERDLFVQYFLSRGWCIHRYQYDNKSPCSLV